MSDVLERVVVVEVEPSRPVQVVTVEEDGLSVDLVLPPAPIIEVDLPPPQPPIAIDLTAAPPVGTGRCCRSAAAQCRRRTA